jgi:hypothetical protein
VRPHLDLALCSRKFACERRGAGLFLLKGLPELLRSHFRGKLVLPCFVACLQQRCLFLIFFRSALASSALRVFLFERLKKLLCAGDQLFAGGGGLHELLGPAVIHLGGNALAATKLANILLAAHFFQHDADLFFRRLLTGVSDTECLLHHLFCRRFVRPGFVLLAATMNLKSSLREDPHLFQWC